MSQRSSTPDTEVEPKPEPVPTAGRPHFALLGIPVRIHPGFFIMPVFLAAREMETSGTPQGEIRAIATWTAVVFFSVMLHEMGHALLGRAFGATPSILLHAMGGVTYLDVRMSRARSGLVSLAGPLAGIVFGSTVAFAARYFGVRDALITSIVGQITTVNIGWGLVNLVPVLPFDGGHILAAALGPRRAFATAIISAVFGAILTVLALRIYWLWAALLFGSATLSAVRHARAARWASSDTRSGLEAKLEEAHRVLDGGDVERARAMAQDISGQARTQELKNRAFALVAWTYVARGDGGLAKAALLRIEPQSAVDPYTFAAVEDAAGDADRAREVLEHARRHGFRSREATKLLVDLHARRGDLAAAANVARDDAALLGKEDARAVLGAALAERRYREAASLAARLFALWGEAADGVDEARAHAMAGERDLAVLALVHAFEHASSPLARGSEGRGAVLADEAFASLRGDARFERLIQETQAG